MTAIPAAATLTPPRHPTGQVVNFRPRTAAQLLATGASRTKPTIDALRLECLNPGRLRNPWASLGCSPILRGVLDLIGVPYAVIVEMANDGDPHSHLGGNALDVDAGEYQLELIAHLQDVPELFAAGLWISPDTPDDSLCIWDGQLVDVEQFSSQAQAAYVDTLHLSSSPARLFAALGQPAVRAALGAP